VSPFRRIAVPLALAVAVVGPAACSSDDGGGESSARAVVDRHVELAAAYDLQGDCELRSPASIEAMAAIDGKEPDTYCEYAVAETVRLASPEVRAAARETYASLRVEEVSADDDRAVFRLASPDGDYTETVTAERVDGGWYVADIQTDGHDHEAEGEGDGDGHDHGDGDVEVEQPPAD